MMYILFKRLLKERLTGIIIRKTDKICDEEKIIQKYGRNTYVLNIHDTDQLLALYGFLQLLIILAGNLSIVGMIVMAMFGLIFEGTYKWMYLLLPIFYLFLLTLTRIGINIYKNYKNIITKDRIIIRRAYKKDRIVTYEEVSEAAKKKKIVIKKAVMYIPTSRKPLRIEMFGNIYSKLALDQIKQKSKIAIPKLTEKRKKYIGQAAISGLYNFFGLLLAGLTLTAAGLWSTDNGVSYFASYTMLPMNMFAIATIGCFVIGKIYYMIGHYRLRKDINDPEHVKIRLKKNIL